MGQGAAHVSLHKALHLRPKLGIPEYNCADLVPAAGLGQVHSFPAVKQTSFTSNLVGRTRARTFGTEIGEHANIGRVIEVVAGRLAASSLTSVYVFSDFFLVKLPRKLGRNKT